MLRVPSNGRRTRVSIERSLISEGFNGEQHRSCGIKSISAYKVVQSLSELHRGPSASSAAHCFIVPHRRNHRTFHLSRTGDSNMFPRGSITNGMIVPPREFKSGHVLRRPFDGFFGHDDVSVLVGTNSQRETIDEFLVRGAGNGTLPRVQHCRKTRWRNPVAFGARHRFSLRIALA